MFSRDEHGQDMLREYAESTASASDPEQHTGLVVRRYIMQATGTLSTFSVQWKSWGTS